MQQRQVRIVLAAALLLVALVAVPAHLAQHIAAIAAPAQQEPTGTAEPAEEPAEEATEEATEDAAVAGASAEACAALAGLQFGPAEITAAEFIAEEWTSPEVVWGAATVALPFCRVSGLVEPAINFEVWLPPAEGDNAWNGKLNGVGNGGLAGELNYPAMAAALERGYAAVSTDTGHTGFLGDGSWALDRPDLLVDFGYRAVHEMTRAAKAVSEAFYGETPAYSYFTGCSGGGQQAMSEAQRYPADYDGIVAGAPAMFPTHMWPGELYVAWVTHRSEENMIPEEKLTLINDAVLAACDADDGVEDGVLGDPRQCTFDPASLLCEGEDAADCLTADQVDSLQLIYQGLQDPTTGEQFWPPYEMGSELQWPGHIFEPFSIPPSYFQYMVLEDPEWDWTAFDFTDPANFELMRDAHYRLGPILNATETDLTAFKELGGKLILWHGWNDQNIAPRNSINYYEDVTEAMGGEENTMDFLRLFMIPGMEHCVGGPGTDTFDALGALEQWVENGEAPEMIEAAHLTDGEVTVTRPLCPYPQVAVYSGEGETNDAASFTCELPE